MSRSVMVMAGGTGGHVFPALAVAEELRSRGMDVFMVSSEGGMEIEEVAKTAPEKIVKEAVVPGFGLRPFQARSLTMALGLEGAAAKQAVGLFRKLYKLYRELDCSIVEINPLIVTEQGDLVALDAPSDLETEHRAYIVALEASRSGIAQLLSNLNVATTFDDIDRAIAGSGYSDAQPRVVAACNTLERAIAEEGSVVHLRCRSVG